MGSNPLDQHCKSSTISQRDSNRVLRKLKKKYWKWLKYFPTLGERRDFIRISTRNRPHDTFEGLLLYLCSPTT
eukprot:snap_masked-scaffold_13-processed-gene-3.45-mRNA-1 protein AED:1.00 eAED:1.00 QI:0/0/0/0/1/1/2/0/72